MSCCQSGKRGLPAAIHLSFMVSTLPAVTLRVHTGGRHVRVVLPLPLPQVRVISGVQMALQGSRRPYATRGIHVRDS
jgi:hypothetical protein